MYFGNAVRLVHLAIAFRTSPEEPSPGRGALPGRERDQRELTITVVNAVI
jgi:hypothetical protein